MATSNTLTGLIPIIYAGLDVVSRELIGFIPNVSRDSTAEAAALNQTVRSKVVPAIVSENITPGQLPASSGGQTFDYVDITISKSKAAPILWSGEEQLSVGGQLNPFLVDQFAQGFRVLANEVEVDLGALYAKASRAYGSAGATPFATAADLSDLAQMNKILDDNGAPATGRVMILGSAARANLEGKHSELFKVNEAGDAGALLRQRMMRQLQGFTMGYSAGVRPHTAGAGTGYDFVAAGEAVGQTTLSLEGGTANTTGIQAGDFVTFAGDTNKYVVTTGLTTAAGDIVIGKPGLLVAGTDTTEMTIGASYTANMGFHRSALHLAARAPAMPVGGDAATDVTTVTDPISGLSFQIAIYRQYRQVKIEIGLAWGVQAIKAENCAILLG